MPKQQIERNLGGWDLLQEIKDYLMDIYSGDSEIARRGRSQIHEEALDIKDEIDKYYHGQFSKWLENNRDQESIQL